MNARPSGSTHLRHQANLINTRQHFPASGKEPAALETAREVDMIDQSRRGVVHRHFKDDVLNLAGILRFVKTINHALQRTVQRMSPHETKTAGRQGVQKPLVSD